MALSLPRLDPPERSVSKTSLLVGRLSGLLRMHSVIRSATHCGHSSGTLRITQVTVNEQAHPLSRGLHAEGGMLKASIPDMHMWAHDCTQRSLDHCKHVEIACNCFCRFHWQVFIPEVNLQVPLWQENLVVCRAMTCDEHKGCKPLQTPPPGLR